MKKIIIILILIVTLVGCDKPNGLKNSKKIYQIALELGYKGSLIEWSNTLEGEQGIIKDHFELSINDGFIKWKNSDETEMYNLISLEQLIGKDKVKNREVTYTVDNNFIKWRFIGEKYWQNLFEISKLCKDSKIMKSSIEQDGTILIIFEDGSTKNLGKLLATYSVEFFDFNRILIESQNVLHGFGAAAPTNPERLGYTFRRWDRNFYEVTSDLKINALYEFGTYTISFDSNGGLEFNDIEYIYCSVLELPEPYKTGYKFMGWYNNDTLYTNDSDITSDINLEALWTLDCFYIYFDSETDPISVVYGDTITELPIPKKDDFNFEGWLLDKEFITLPYVYLIGEDIHLKSSWNGNYDGVDYKIVGEEAIVTGYKDSKENINLPDKIHNSFVTCIESNAFLNNDKLKSITLGSFVEEIKDNAFSNMINLENLIMPASAKLIGNNILSGTESIKTLTISGEAEISLFQLFNKEIPKMLKEVKIADGSKYITLRIILSDVEDVKLILQSNITEINDNEFASAYYSEIVLPEGLIRIGNDAFLNSRIKRMVVPFTVNIIEDRAFYSCENLEYIRLPDEVEFYDINFGNCKKLKEIIIPKGVKTLRYFNGCKSLTNVVIPETVTSIDNNAFFYCSSLTSITIPNSVVSIGSSAFSNCTSLTNITFPDTITTINSHTFEKCISLSNFIIPESVTIIDDYAFSGCESLKSINIPTEVNIINDYTFNRCSSLTNIILPDKVSSIGDYAFSNCTLLSNINLPDDLKSIGKYAFYNCSSITYINLINTITYIGDFAFAHCSSLESISIPRGVSRIEPCTFLRCVLLSKIDMHNDISFVGSFAFSYCQKLKSIEISKKVTFIGVNAFEKCTNLKIYCEAIDLPETWDSNWNISKCEVVWNYTIE